MFGRQQSENPEIKAALIRINSELEKRPNDPLLLTERGQICLAAQRYPEAISNFTQALKANGQHIPALLGLARSYYHNDDLNRALQLLIKAEAAFPMNADIFSLQGELFALAEQAPRAIQAFTKALQLNPTRSKDALARARLLVKSEQYEQAVADLNLAVQRLPDNAEAHHLLAMALRATKAPDQALAHHHRAVELNRNDPLYFQERGITLLMLGDVDGALRDLDIAVKADNINLRALYHRGLAHLQKDHQKNALRDFDAVAKLDRHHIKALTHRGEILMRQKAWKQVEENETTLLEEHKINAPSLFRRGHARLAMRLYEDAIADFTRVMSINLNDPEPFLQRAEVHLIRGDMPPLRSDLEEAVRLGTRDPRWLKMLAEICLKSKAYAEAVKYYTMAIEVNPDDSALHASRGEAAYHARDFVVALADFEKLSKETRKPDATLMFNLGSVYLEVQSYAAAAECFEEAMDLGLKDPATLLALSEAQMHLGETKEARKLAEKVMKSTRDPGIKAMAERLLNQMKR